MQMMLVELIRNVRENLLDKLLPAGRRPRKRAADLLILPIFANLARIIRVGLKGGVIPAA
jgi:hypothetical protein